MYCYDESLRLNDQKEFYWFSGDSFDETANLIFFVFIFTREWMVIVHFVKHKRS